MKTPIKAKKKICKGFRRSEGHKGEPCKMRAVEGSDFCKYHGGGAVGKKTGKGRPKGTPKPKGAGGSPPKGNENAKKHGAYSTRLSPEEMARYESIRSRYEKGFNNLSEIDKDCIHRLVLFEVKLESAIESGAPGDALEPLQRMVHRELKVLQATREAKDANVMTGNTPAEVVAAMLLKVRAVDEPRQVNMLTHDPDVIDVEVTPVNPDDGGQKE